MTDYINSHSVYAVNSGIRYADAYYRLSNEEEKRGESESIKNQRQIVRSFCQKRNIVLVDEFVDDGYSGANFNRPGFKAMLKHLEKGNIQMVITKDLSRLGRDMSESSFYAENFFPERHIRYIAIGDDFDSDKDNLMAGFKFAINEYYVRDSSRKVKQVLASKREHGEYCACPPFGYMKNPHDKTKLVPDPNTAPTVQRIFNLAYSGESTHSISDKLTQEGVITPLKYRVYHRDQFGDRGAARATDVWVDTTVKRILVNPVYLGHTMLGKYKKVSYKSDTKVLLPKEDWSIIYNTHEPLVAPEIFDGVQYYLGMHKKDWRDKKNVRHNIFSGVIFCENCGSAMCSCGTTYKGDRDKYWYLSCQRISHKNPEKRCTHGARIKYSDLLELIRADLSAIISLNEDDIKEISEAASALASEDNQIYAAKEESPIFIQKRLTEIDTIIMKLYQDNYAGIIDDQRLQSMIKMLDTESKKLKEQLEVLSRKQAESNAFKSSIEEFCALAKRYSDFEELTPEIVRTFIDRIEVGERILPDGYEVATHDNIPFKQTIRIYYRFLGELKRNQTSDDKKYDISPVA